MDGGQHSQHQHCASAAVPVPMVVLEMGNTVAILRCVPHTGLLPLPVYRSTMPPGPVDWSS
jgi:hypothetical protein